MNSFFSFLKLLFIVAPIFSYSQILIPHAGFNVSTVIREPKPLDTKIKPIIGFSVGVGYEFTLTKRLSLLAETKYITKGYNHYLERHSEYGVVLIEDFIYRHRFIEIPILFKKYYNISKVKIYLNAGAYLAVGMGGAFKGESRLNAPRPPSYHSKYDGRIKYGDAPDNLFDYEDWYYVNRTDYGLIAGFGIMIKKLTIDVRYEWGQRNIDDPGDVFRNRTAGINIGVPVNLKKN